MNISKYEQRTRHALAQGGRIDHHKNAKGDIIAIECFNRNGWRLDDCSLDVFKKLRKRGFIMSRNGGPYHITREGLAAVRPQVDNR